MVSEFILCLQAQTHISVILLDDLSTIPNPGGCQTRSTELLNRISYAGSDTFAISALLIGNTYSSRQRLTLLSPPCAKSVCIEKNARLLTLGRQVGARRIDLPPASTEMLDYRERAPRVLTRVGMLLSQVRGNVEFIAFIIRLQCL